MAKLKALVTAEVVKSTLEEKLGSIIEFVYDGYCLNHDVMSHKELIEKVRDIDILVCEYDTISSEVFDAAQNLKIIVCCRGGVKTVIDLNKAMEKGIVVCNNSGRNAGAVTDMTMGYILDLTRNITFTNNLIHSKTITMDESSKPAEYQDTVWGLDNDSPFIKYRGHSINHMVLGIVGFGHAGKLLASKANAFDMKILAYDPYCDFENKPDYVESTCWEELIAKSDVLSVHCTLSPQTKNMFRASVFQQMKDGAYFINTSRGELVVEDDLIEALNSGKLAGAAIDVTVKEPISSNNPLVGTKNLIITPHIAGSADDVQFCGTNMVIDSLTDYLKGKKPRNAVVYV